LSTPFSICSEGFVEGIKTSLGAMAGGRKVTETAKAYQLRESSALYGGHFGTKKEDIALENTYLRDVYDE